MNNSNRRGCRQTENNPHRHFSSWSKSSRGSAHLPEGERAAANRALVARLLPPRARGDAALVAGSVVPYAELSRATRRSWLEACAGMAQAL